MSTYRRGITYDPMSARDQERANNLRFIYHSDDRRCVELLRMRRAPFFQLCDLFRNKGLLRDSINNNIEEQVAMFLLVVGHNQRFRVLKPVFRRSLETISRYFQEVLYAVEELRNEMMCHPHLQFIRKFRVARSGILSSRWESLILCSGKLNFELYQSYLVQTVQHQGTGDPQTPSFRDEDTPAVLWTDRTSKTSSWRDSATHRHDQTLLL
jgi:hypothetical protein